MKTPGLRRYSPGTSICLVQMESDYLTFVSLPGFEDVRNNIVPLTSQDEVAIHSVWGSGKLLERSQAAPEKIAKWYFLDFGQVAYA